MERSQIKTEETWDLTKIYKNDEDFYEDLNKAKALLETLVKQKDSFLDNVDNFYAYHEDYILLSRYIQKTHSFAHLHCDVEPKDQRYQTMLASVLSFYDQVNASLDFYTVSIISHSQLVKEFLKDDRL